MIVTLVIPSAPYDTSVPHEARDYPPVGQSYDRVDYSVDGGHVPRQGDQLLLQSAPAGINPRGQWTVGRVSWIFTERGCAQVEVWLK